MQAAKPFYNKMNGDIKNTIYNNGEKTTTITSFIIHTKIEDQEVDNVLKVWLLLANYFLF